VVGFLLLGATPWSALSSMAASRLDAGLNEAKARFPRYEGGVSSKGDVKAARSRSAHGLSSDHY